MYVKTAMLVRLDASGLPPMAPAVGSIVLSMTTLALVLCHCFGRHCQPCRRVRDEAVLDNEGRRQKAAMRTSMELSRSENPFEKKAPGGPPGSPQRLRAAEASLWDVSEASIARRAERRQQALLLLASRHALKPEGEL